MRLPLAALPAAPPPPPRSGPRRPGRHLLMLPARLPPRVQPRMSRPAERTDDDAAADPARAARDAELAALVHAAADGDCTAFEAFYDRTLAYAETVARRMLHGPDLEDLLADAYFEAWRCAARFDAARGSAVTWLLTIVRSRALDALRRIAARPAAAADDDAAADAVADGPDPVDVLWQRQAGARLHAALAQLEPRERWTLGLAYFGELSHAEIAAATRLPLGTVKSVLARAQAKLRLALAAPTS
jgi:RNA polymerase sigma-70 factor, ECF subfamily